MGYFLVIVALIIASFATTLRIKAIAHNDTESHFGG
jgi:hypothetical protein